jgi:small ligand-binding sensory domain FIST
MVATWDFDPSAQWLDDAPVDRSVLALLLSGLRVDSTILHGSRPTSAYYTVTRADGTTVLELDGQPALDVVLGLVDAETAQSIEGFPPILTVGVNAGDPYGEPQEEDFVVRGCLSLDHERRGLVFQNDDLTPGTRLQLMRRSIDMGDVRQRVGALLARLEGRRPVLAIYFDCAGRASTICSSDGEDAHAVREALGPAVPLVGAYSWMELAQLHGDLRALNYTGVLTILSE